jgi:hypothetical protein
MQVSNVGPYQQDPSLFVSKNNGDLGDVNNIKGQNGGASPSISFTDVAGKDSLYRQAPINKSDVFITENGPICQQARTERIEEAAKQGEAKGSKWGGVGGAAVGSMTGGSLGVLVGTAFLPGPGSAIGGAIGGVLGAVGWGALLGVTGSLLGGIYGRRDATNEAQEYTPACSKQRLDLDPLKPQDQPKSQDPSIPQDPAAPLDQPHPTGPHHNILAQQKESDGLEQNIESEVAQAA